MKIQDESMLPQDWGLGGLKSSHLIADISNY